MKKLVFFCLASLLTISCEKGIFNEDYNYMYGDWIPVQIDSGMGYYTYPQMLCDFLQVLKNGTYNVVRNSSTTETGIIKVEAQTVNELSIKFIPREPYSGSDSYISLSHSTLNVVTLTQDSIRLLNNAVDGGYYALTLKRKN
jgi:hypothetical protein